MKKILALVLALCMVFVLCACGSGNSGTTSSASPDAAASSDTSAASTDTETVAVTAVIIAADTVPEDVIYKFTSTIFDNLDAISEQHAKGSEASLEQAASITSVPYHPGAAKYYQEKGITVEAVKEGAGTGSGSALTFGTGGEAGTYYAFGGVLAQYVSSNTDVSVTAVSSGGSQANIEDIAAGTIQLGFVQSDVMSYAFNGERLFTEPVKGFSVVAAMYMEQVQIVTTNPSIKSVADLKGKTVSIGASGSGVYFNAIDVLESYGLSESDISPVYQSFGDSADSLKDGKIDAGFIVAGAPTTAITDLAASKDVYLVSLDEEHILQLLEKSPYYVAYTIPAGTY